MSLSMVISIWYFGNLVPTTTFSEAEGWSSCVLNWFKDLVILRIADSFWHKGILKCCDGERPTNISQRQYRVGEVLSTVRTSRRKRKRNWPLCVLPYEICAVHEHFSSFFRLPGGNPSRMEKLPGKATEEVCGFSLSVLLLVDWNAVENWRY